MTSHSTHQELVTKSVISELNGSASVSFLSLLRSLPGIDPLLVLKELHTHSKSSGRYANQAKALLEDSNTKRDYAVRSHPHPVPHPLDYDWRYSPKGLMAIIEQLERKVTAKGVVALLGAPTLAKALSERRSTLQLHLFDQNTLWGQLIDGVAFHELDLASDGVPKEVLNQADYVVLDPPWYIDTYKHFIWYGSQLLNDGGTLAISVLPIGTRPSADADRRKIMDYAKSCGLVFVGEETAALNYSTPPFERNAFRAAGISTAIDEWRHADLWEYRPVQNAAGSSRPEQEKEVSTWHELTLDVVRIRFDMTASSGLPELHSLVHGDVLPTVSARDPRRENATVWTSGNRIFHCSNSQRLYDLCQSIEWPKNVAEVNASRDSTESRALKQIEELVQLEILEYGGHIG